MLPLLLNSGSIFVFGQNIEVFNSSNSGLPENTIRSITISSSGEKIIGTDGGLSIYDGTNFTNYNTSNSPLIDNSIRALKEDNNGNLWIGTTFAGVYLFDGSNWTNYTPENCGVPDHFIRTVNQDLSGNMWFGTIEGLAKFDGTTWTTWTLANSGINSNNIASILVKPNNEKIIGTLNGGIIYYDDLLMTEFTILEGGIPDNSVTDIDLDDQGNLWFATPSSGFYKDDGNQNWEVFSMTTSAIPTNGLTSICFNAANGMIYGGSLESGLIRYNPNNGVISNFTTSNSLLPNNHITCLERDNEGVLWIGTAGGGLVKWTDPDAGIQSESNKNLVIFPNPAQHKLSIESEDPLNEFSLFNSAGQIVFRKELLPFQKEVDLPLLPNGTYIGRFRSLSNEGHYRKIIIFQ
jgi:ligand-binding sensor domain-containing protein